MLKEEWIAKETCDRCREGIDDNFGNTNRQFDQVQKAIDELRGKISWILYTAIATLLSALGGFLKG